MIDVRRRGRIVARSFVAFLIGAAVAVGVEAAVTPLLFALATSSQNVGAVSGGFIELVIFPVLGLVAWAVVMLPLLIVLDRRPIVTRRSRRLAVGVVLGSITWALFSVIVWPGRPANFAAAVFEWLIPATMMGAAMVFYRPPPDV